ncbi:hypothetical protein F4679DRAFT_566254 [Xylaria curta]|nr:hypothetical protein F4679DRAFT_566254 [Xylaria curta]
MWFATTRHNPVRFRELLVLVFVRLASARAEGTHDSSTASTPQITSTAILDPRRYYVSASTSCNTTSVGWIGYASSSDYWTCGYCGSAFRTSGWLGGCCPLPGCILPTACLRNTILEYPANGQYLTTETCATTNPYCQTLEVYRNPEATAPYLQGVVCAPTNEQIVLFRETTTEASTTSSLARSNTITTKSTTSSAMTTLRQATSTQTTSTQATTMTIRGAGGGSGLSTSDKIGLGAGIVGGVGAIIGFLAWRFPRRR